MEEQAKIVSNILKALAEEARPYHNLLKLEKLTEELIKKYGATSVNKGYVPKWNKDLMPFPSVLCVGVNDTIAHGFPFDYALRPGDLVSFDLGIKYKGLCGDAALTVPVGEVDNRAQRLLWYAKKTLYAGIAEIKPGATNAEVGRAMERYANSRGFVVNKTFVGHGIGKTMHEQISMPAYDFSDEDVTIELKKLKEGDVICLEPMLTYKDDIGVFQKNGWEKKTSDGRNSAFFEHMIEVTKTGAKVLTNHISED